jgi:hypothetical protein
MDRPGVETTNPHRCAAEVRHITPLDSNGVGAGNGWALCRGDLVLMGRQSNPYYRNYDPQSLPSPCDFFRDKRPSRRARSLACFAKELRKRAMLFLDKSCAGMLPNG